MSHQTKNKLKSLRRRQLDRQFSLLMKCLKDFDQPKDGWIKEIRSALGMTGGQLAKRMAIAHPTLNKIEESEAKGTIAVSTLNRAAEALGCRLAYVLVPKQLHRGASSHPLEDMVRARAKQLAEKMISELSKTMALEKQDIDQESKKKQIEEIVQELLKSGDGKLWSE